MAEFPLENISTTIKLRIISRTPGRIRLRVSPEKRNGEAMEQIVASLKVFLPQIQKIRTNIPTGSLTVYYDPEEVNFDEILDQLPSLGIILEDAPRGLPETSRASTLISSAVAGINQKVKQATEGNFDLRFLFPLFFTLLALRQAFSKSPRLKMAPWYILAWYAFDSFLKLNESSEKSESNLPHQNKP